MTPAKLSQVEQMRASGHSLTEIADALSVARATIYRHLQDLHE
jgi:DNA-binding CsgD family transcriptional regulator